MLNNASSPERHEVTRHDRNETLTSPVPYATNLTVQVPKEEPRSPSRNSLESMSLDSSIPSAFSYITLYKLKEPIVLLERCDKIWETLKLIRNIQSKSPDRSMPDSTRTSAKEAAAHSVITEQDNPESGPSYIEYHPVLGNGNKVLPNLKFFVKSKRKLFICAVCSKQYVDGRSYKLHLIKVHGIHDTLRVSERNKHARQNISRSVDKKSSSENRKPSENTTENKTSKGTFAGKNSSKESHVKTSELHSKKMAVNSNSVSTPNNSVSNKKSLANGNKESEKCVLTNGIQQSSNKSPTTAKSVTKNETLYIQCILCKQYVQDITAHLINYHKIEVPADTLKEFGLAPSITDIKSSFTANKTGNKESSQSDEKGNSSKIQNPSRTGVKRQSSAANSNYKKRLRKDNTSVSSSTEKQPLRKWYCNICQGLYASRESIRYHRRFHALRGETKENFHLSIYRHQYVNSPLSKAQNSESNCSEPTNADPVTSHEKANNVPSTDKDIHSTNTKATPTPDELPERSSNQKELLISTQQKSTGEDTSIETTCDCGRVFRNPHTLYLHKSKYKCDQNREVTSTTRNSSDRDSGIGISITIKKRNDSYEIVGKDSGDETKCKNSGSAKDNDLDVFEPALQDEEQDMDQQSDDLDSLERSKYSKDHSILKLERVDEDIIVEIEDDSPILPDDGINMHQKNEPTKTANVSNDVSEINQTNESTKTENVSNAVREINQTNEPTKTENVSDDKMKIHQTNKPTKTANVSDNVIKVHQTNESTKTTNVSDDVIEIHQTNEPTRMSNVSDDVIATYQSNKPTGTPNVSDDVIETHQSNEPTGTPNLFDDVIEIHQTNEPTRTHKTYTKNTERKTHEILPLRTLCRNTIVKYNLLHAELKKKLRVNICTCGKEFTKFSLFNDHVSVCNSLLTKCRYCKRKFENVFVLYKHECPVKKGKKYVDSKLLLKCPLCKISVDNRETFDRHVSRKHFNPNAMHQCYECLRRFRTDRDRQNHVTAEHYFKYCVICQKYYDLYLKERHTAYHEGLGFPCHKCKRAYPSKEKLKMHINIVHIKRDKVTCPLCQKAFKVNGFKQHLPTHTHLKYCEVCDKSYLTIKNLEAHVKHNHRNNYPYLRCNFCYTIFLTKNQLATHLKKPCDESKVKFLKQNIAANGTKRAL